MRRRVKLLPQLGDEQARAADPRIHAALSASAGTGKTQVLTARVLRLLLDGVAPENILCLTFTKAGAAEMVNRISARLAAWVRMKDSDLGGELQALRADPGPDSRRKARRLFARVLDAPGGLRIQTIHGFAQSLLASFPAEAGIAPGFQPIEGRAEQELVRRTLADLLADAEASGDERLIADVQCLSLRLGEGPAVDYLTLCAKKHEALAALGAANDIEPRLRAILGVPEGSVEDFLAAHCADDQFDCDLLQAIAEANRKWGTASAQDTVTQIEQWLAMDGPARATALGELALLVFTGKGELRKVKAGQLRADPDYERHCEALAQAISELLHVQRSARLACDMAAGLRAGQAFAGAYVRAKRSAGVADFDDLIAWCRELLDKPGMGDWVRYKLDRRIDHILVDEAQDTNAGQWEIVKALAGEFFSGASESDRRHRTIFMVGDFKQAIFGFQGTNPHEFNRARQWVGESASALLAAESGAEPEGERLAREFKDLSIAASFRSNQPVLDVVDAMIREVGFDAMGLPEPPPPHRAWEGNRRKPALVELWQPFSIGDGEDEGDEAGEEGWLDEKERRYAEALAGQVKSWLEEAPVLASTKRPLTPGDILILVRSRAELASLIVARLFMAGVPIAGIDRLHLSKPFAVRDLLAAVGFAVQPMADLNLANLLVSPLIGWNQQQLFDLAHGRGKKALWRILVERADERDDFAEARSALGALLTIADFTTPHRFLETILSGPLDGRRRLYGRLGLAARDPIDELLSSALEFERNEIPSLDRFVAWFGRGEVEVQRDPSASTNAVRVMTVHGAKGLEAPFVILADSTADPRQLGRRNAPLDYHGFGQPVPVIRPSRSELVAPFDRNIALQEQLDLEEHWRLLYVGMTRAIERLVVAGAERNRMVDDCWHKRVERALQSLGAQWEDDSRWRRRIRYDGGIGAAPAKPKPPRSAPEPISVPDWVRAPAPPEARPPRPLAPSALAEDREAALPPGEAMRAAARRGTLIHALFERLPDVAPGARNAAAKRWLERSAGVADDAEREELASLVCSILADPAYSPLFSEGSLGEAPIAAALPDGRVIAGTVDRLLVEPERVSVIDFKTGRVPAGDSAIPRSHRVQMEAYAEALRVIFPGREIRAALLYTGGPQLIDVAG